MKRIIGTNYLGYTQLRNFAGLPFNNYEFRKVYDLYKFPSYFYFKLFNKSNQYYLNSFQDFNLNKVDLLHFFNGVSYGQTPWITTNVKHIPRYIGYSKTEISKGLKTLTKPQFKKLISISQINHTTQINFLNEFAPEIIDEVSSKMMVLHPAQKEIFSSINEKHVDGNFLTFTIAASTGFFGKGGREILNAFDYLLEKKYQLKLNIISKFEYGDWASKTTIHDYNNAMKIIAKYPNNIKTFGFISNEDVLKIFQESDIGLLPTYADTYGYSVLEAQAAGCPVISTNIRSLPEINNNEMGWLINVVKKENGNALLDTQNDIQQFSKTIEEELITIIENVYANKSILREKGKLCILHIEKNHNIKDKTRTLEEVYNQALNE
jgi:glycosyltransferase involved in cell wall biosynthesis